MNRVRTIAALILTGLVLSSYSLRADVRSDQKAHVEFAGMLGRMFNMFGGKSAREGVTTSIAVKGDRSYLGWLAAVAVVWLWNIWDASRPAHPRV